MKDKRGQGAVEFTLIIVFLLIIAWIPADMALAMYTGQLAQNASREGARIAAATPGLVAQVPAGTAVSCTLPCSSAGELLRAMANRTSSALLPGATLTLNLQGGTSCDRLITATVQGNYSYFFYRLLRTLGFNIGTSTTINRQTSMRWEHAC